MEISKASIKLLAYLETFQKFSIPYEEEIKPKELKILLDHMVGKNKTYNQTIFNDIIERIEEKEKNLTIKEFVRTVLEAEHSITLKIKKLENIKINYKRLLNRIDENSIFLQDRQKTLENYEKGENFFVIDIIMGENFDNLHQNQDFNANVAYLILKYFQTFKETAYQKTTKPVWNEKFRLYILYFRCFQANLLNLLGL